MAKSAWSVKKGFSKYMVDAKSKNIKSCALYVLEISIWLNLENASQNNLGALNI